MPILEFKLDSVNSKLYLPVAFFASFVPSRVCSTRTLVLYEIH